MTTSPRSHEPIVSGLSPDRRAVFAARLERWWPTLVEGLASAYEEPEVVAERVVVLAARAFAERSDDLHDLDLRRSLAPDWFQRPEAVGYAAYADRFAGTLRGVAERAPYLRRLGISYLHLLPLLKPRPGDNDGGYAVMDYRAVREDLGTMDDLTDLTRTLREDGISLCLDLVLNHVAAEHEWAEKARAGDPHYRDYFIVHPDREVPDAFEATLPEVFPDFAPGSFTWDDDLDGWVWTTFNSWQWDVNWANPDVFCEYADIVLALANRGVEALRLDAIAFIWKRMGTSCQNQPEVHALTQALHTVTKLACPATIFKAEAIVGPRDLVGYLGVGAHHGKVSDLAYHNGLMVQVWSMLATGDVRLASEALRRIDPIPTSTAWITYARCHDDIGWAIDDGDAAAVGVDGFRHRSFLADFYAGSFPGSWARGLVFQHNPETGDRRISGTLASLAGLEAGDPWAVDRILLAHALILGWGGLPVLWMGDEIGLLNDIGWADDPQHGDDNRWAHRPRMPWSVEEDQDLFQRVRRLVAARAGTPHLHAATGTTVLDPHDSGVLLTLRLHPLGPMVGAYNVTDTDRWVWGSHLRDLGLEPHGSHDHVSGGAPHLDGPGDVRLRPYQAVWLTATLS
ncbi:alpha-amylase family protein [Nocardioides currus]|uniref:Alpha-amylase n=1 Tax=Nocardioides currus TaxID=2133958 RepID=A0A2R7YRX2_9ACTN|nr:alpha-amylase family protein [Nocardioides currus]PUA79132.1 alpha-amylase [Nocardioides currus]